MFYISGTHAMTNAFKKTLREMGVPRAHIKTDFFPGYSASLPSLPKISYTVCVWQILITMRARIARTAVRRAFRTSSSDGRSALTRVVGMMEAPPAAIWRGIKPAARQGAAGAARARDGAVLPPRSAWARSSRARDDKNNWRARVLWEEAERRGIVMREFRPFGLAREIFYATYGSDTKGFDGLPRPRAAHEAALDWMDDKGVILKKFRAAGVPVPRGGSVSSVKAAEKIFHEIDG